MMRSLLNFASVLLLTHPGVADAQEVTSVLLPIGAAPYTAHQPKDTVTSSGWAALGFRIDTEGRAYAVSVLARDGDPAIGPAAIAAVDRWVFSTSDRLEFACALAISQNPDSPLSLVALQKAFEREPLCSLEKQMVFPAGQILLDDR
jgi:hypothetical protein